MHGVTRKPTASGQGEPCSGGWEFLAGDYAPSSQGFNTDPAATVTDPLFSVQWGVLDFAGRMAKTHAKCFRQIDGPAADMTSIYNYGHDDYEGTVTD